MKTPKSLLAIDKILLETPTSQIKDDEFTAEMVVERAALRGEVLTLNKVKCRLRRKVENRELKKRRILKDGHYINVYRIYAKDA